MNSPNVGRGHIINAARRLSEKLIIIWKLELPHVLLLRLFLLLLLLFSHVRFLSVYIYYTLRPRDSRELPSSYETTRGKRFSRDADARAKRDRYATAYVFSRNGTHDTRGQCLLARVYLVYTPPRRKSPLRMNKTISLSLGGIYQCA